MLKKITVLTMFVLLSACAQPQSMQHDNMPCCEKCECCKKKSDSNMKECPMCLKKKGKLQHEEMKH